MCGLWASIALPAERERITRVAHRGPDGEGWSNFASPAGPVYLGHRRLAIIDTSEAASQPMSDPTGRYWLVYNGEIYNYIELRQELAETGVSFRTQSDSEVLIAALVRWGPAALDRLVGMFAFAFWDDVAKSLFLARDRFGIKPLYYAATALGLAVASEIKQLHDLPGLARRMNLPCIRDFLELGILDHTDETMFAGIRQLRGGEHLTVDARSWRPGGRLDPRRWYSLPQPGSIDLGLPEAARRYRDLFDQSIGLHLRSDVRVGSCLSGGLDSTAIVAAASRRLGADNPMTTVSASFAGSAVDEMHYARLAIEASGADGRFVTLAPTEVMELAEKATWFQDEPFGSTSILAQWVVFEEARRAGIKVMLDGQGADETLAGYHWLYPERLVEHLRHAEGRRALALMRDRRLRLGHSLATQALTAAAVLAPPQLRQWARRWRRRIAGRDWLAGPAMRHLLDEPDAHVRADLRSGGGQCSGLAGELARLTTATNLPMLLHWEDRSSMAHSIEARVPFLDHRLVELTIGLGPRHKIEGTATKVLLRAAVPDLLPGPIAARTDKLWLCDP